MTGGPRRCFETKTFLESDKQDALRQLCRTALLNLFTLTSQVLYHSIRGAVFLYTRCDLRVCVSVWGAGGAHMCIAVCAAWNFSLSLSHTSCCGRRVSATGASECVSVCVFITLFLFYPMGTVVYPVRKHSGAVTWQIHTLNLPHTATAGATNPTHKPQTLTHTHTHTFSSSSFTNKPINYVTISYNLGIILLYGHSLQTPSFCNSKC